MKPRLISILVVSLFLVLTSSSLAQSTTDAAEKADNLRLQLLDVQTKEAALEERVRQLDEDLKPENIERSLAGIGSTRPEELRERRRRQLQIEKDSLTTQLGQLVKTRTELEAAIAGAEAEAYQQSAKGPGSAGVEQALLTQVFRLPKWLTLLLITLPTALAIAGLLMVVKRLKRTRSQETATAIDE